MKSIVILLSFLQACSFLEMSGHETCIKVRQTLGRKTQCEHSEELLIFFQSSLSGNSVVKFSKKNDRKLRIECLNFRVAIDLDKIPQLNFGNVNKIELSECSLSNETLLTKIKASFRIKKVKFLSIIATHEQNNVNIGEKFFENLVALEDLEMKTNYKVTFSERAFMSLKNLKMLRLQVHDVITLPFNVFFPLENLQSLVISNTGLPKYERKELNISLKNCINMKSFSLTEIRWPVSIKTGLVNFVGPLKISIQNNQIIEINSKTFDKASHIEEIHLNNNSIKYLPGDLFLTQISLSIVDLSRNQIKELHQDIFKTATSLESIDVSFNNLKSVDRKYFMNLKYLSRLNLAHNNFIVINFMFNFGNLEALEKLELSHNKIEKIVGNLSCTNLRELDLRHNSLKRFFVDQFWIFSKKNLTVDLTENSLESVDFRDLNYVENLTAIPYMFVKVDDEITCNCHTLSLFNFTIRRLNIDDKVYEKIKVFPKTIKCIRKSSETPAEVTDIQISKITCPLDFPHQIFCPIFCICDRRPFDGFLIVKCGNISVVPQLPHFKILKDIKLDKIELNIAGNGIKELPSKLNDVNYNDVTDIYASYNSIQSIEIFNIPDRLEYLDLKHNRLSHINAYVIEKFTKLRFLHLSNNPWNCALAIDLVRFVKKFRHIEKDFNMIQCSSYKYFLEIETENQCFSEILAFVIISMSLVGTTAVIIVCFLKRKAVVEWIFVKDRYGLFEKAIAATKIFDGIICVAKNDQVFGKYIAAKLIERPNHFKIGYVVKDWSSNEDIPRPVLRGFKNARRIIVILSEYFEESDWSRWNFFNTNTRIIFIVKGKRNTENVQLTNIFSIKFGDPWFWEKLRYVMTHRKELNLDECLKDVEMKLLENVTIE